MKKRKIIAKKDLRDLIRITILLICGTIGYIVGFVIFDFSVFVAGAITGAIAGGLYGILDHYVFKKKKPIEFKQYLTEK